MAEKVRRDDFEMLTWAMTEMVILMHDGLQDIRRVVETERREPLELKCKQCQTPGLKGLLTVMIYEI